MPKEVLHIYSMEAIICKAAREIDNWRPESKWLKERSHEIWLGNRGLESWNCDSSIGNWEICISPCNEFALVGSKSLMMIHFLMQLHMCRWFWNKPRGLHYNLSTDRAEVSHNYYLVVEDILLVLVGGNVLTVKPEPELDRNYLNVRCSSCF
jgi:hypothetical protein